VSQDYEVATEGKEVCKIQLGSVIVKYQRRETRAKGAGTGEIICTAEELEF
jgi:hypothetical protein